MVQPNFDLNSLTGPGFDFPATPPLSPQPTPATQDWAAAEDVTQAEVRNYKVKVQFHNQAGDTYSTPPLSVAVEAFQEGNQTRYQAVWMADRLVLGYGDTGEDAIHDMADFLVNDLSSLEDDDTAGLTPKAIQRRTYLRGLFGTPA